MNIQEKLSSLMKEKKISASALSREISIPNSTLADILKGKTERIAINVMFPLAEFFNCSVDYLVKDDILDINYGKPRDSDFSLSEHDLVERFRRLNLTNQQAVSITINGMLAVQDAEKRGPITSNNVVEKLAVPERCGQKESIA